MEKVYDLFVGMLVCGGFAVLFLAVLFLGEGVLYVAQWLYDRWLWLRWMNRHY